jgi:hypothetical protein
MPERKPILFCKKKMTSQENIVEALKSADASVRNAAALRMIDTDAVDFIPALTDAIMNADNVGANGTLVYALGHFDCNPYFRLLVAVALRHKFEASCEACSILLEHDFELLDKQIAECRRLVDSAQEDTLTDFQMVALAQIRERFCGENLPNNHTLDDETEHTKP